MYNIVEIVDVQSNRLTSVTPTGGSSAAVTFDANGNTLTDASGRSYTWDSENRMVSCTYNGDTTTYTYGYDGLRRSSTKDSVTTNYVYDGTNLVAEMRPNASGTLVIVTSYLLGAQGIEAKIDETAQTEAYYELNPTTGARLFDANNNLIVAYRGVTSWYIYDGHGNVVGTVNGVTGAFTANPTLDVYGIPRASGTSATKQGYCGSLGHVTDDTGLVYMRARYYDPNVGRFVSEDPGGNGTNWYVYAGDNPVSCVDCDGRSTQWFDWVLSAIANGNAAGAGASFSYCALLGALSTNAATSILGRTAAFTLTVALGLASVTCWAIGLGANAPEALEAVVAGGIIPLVTAVLQSASGARMGAGASAIAGAAITATAAYTLCLIGALVADDCTD
jgi:RHS repeat-associated protein